MPRAKLYRTASEKKAANRQKNAKYYAKNRVDINHKRRALYCSKSGNTSSFSEILKSDCSHTTKPMKNEDSAYWLAKCATVEEKFLVLINHAGKDYCRDLIQQWIRSVLETGPDLTILETAHKDMCALRGKYVRYFGKLLNCGGYDKAAERVERVKERIKTVVQWIEDILCSAMEGVEELLQQVKEGNLIFQKYGV
ncbi:hypothetical protein BDP27DRAFT_1366227 [Rhodocollybia butyracea]|uniref:Uncharacterized protein n=1 Tax=Rhodocollybia butyracea TaxID=206335 RepID=A0A9P5U463_9AGAR|nr:hypothetical protein BDP27DRAFT_1366227 [Rhodocollybia butyracea]